MFIFAKNNRFSIEDLDGKACIDFRKFLLLTSSMTSNVSMSDVNKILSKIPAEYYVKMQDAKSGRNSRVSVYLYPMGLVSYLSSSYRFSHSEKDDILKQLKDLGLVDSGIHISVSRAELSFLSDLQEFFSYFGIKVKDQFAINGQGIICDFLIGDDLIVEYDENNHAGYDKAKETEREKIIIAKGYRFMRLSDSQSNAKNLAKVAKEALWTTD